MQKALLLCLLLFNVILASSQSAASILPLTGNNLRPLIVGHRGGFDTILPENSICLFDYTVQNACYHPVGIEFDIRESASGSLYVMHDETLDRTTNGTGRITGLQDTYIESLFLKDRNGALTKEKIPLFKEVLSHFQNKNVILMLDVKENILPQVIKQVQLMHMESECILLTFNVENTRMAKLCTTDMMISALVKSREDWEPLPELNIPAARLIAYISKTTTNELISEINEKGVRIVTDISEDSRNNSKCYEPGYYLKLPEEKNVDIIMINIDQ